MQKDYLIQEKPLRALLVFAFPMIIGNLFQQFYTMADSVVVGRFVGENALAAVGASYSLTNVFISVAIGGGVGASVLTGRSFGAKDYRKMKMSVYTALVSFLALSVTLAAVGLIFSENIMELLNTPENVLEDAAEYLSIYFMGLPFLFMYNVLSAMFNALGRSKIPLYLLIFSSLFNIGLDVFMVCALHMGVAGAAWATLIAQGISAVVSFLIFRREIAAYESGEKTPVFDRGQFGSMCRIALPSILQQSTVSIGMMLVQSVVNSFGAEMLAGFSAAMRVESICVVPMAAIGNAISSFTAQNMGAGRQERVVKGYHAAYGIVFSFALLICAALEGFYEPLVRMFLGEDGTALAMQTGAGYLKFMGWFFALIGLKMITDSVLRGSGDMKMFTVANMVNLSIRVILAMTLAPRFGIAMVWYAVPVGWLANYLISFAEYRTGKWKRGGMRTRAKSLSRPFGR